MYLITNNFDGKVIDEANYQVYSKDNTISITVPKSTVNLIKKYVIIAGTLYDLTYKEKCIYESILLTIRNFYFKGIDTRIIKLDEKFFLRVEGANGINKRNAKIALDGLIKKEILRLIYTPNQKLYRDRLELTAEYTPDNVIKHDVDCIVIKL